MIEHYTI